MCKNNCSMWAPVISVVTNKPMGPLNGHHVSCPEGRKHLPAVSNRRTATIVVPVRMGKLALLSLLTRTSSEGPVTLGNTRGFVQSIQREDGSGSSFNVTMCPLNMGPNISVYVRTMD